MAIPSSPHCVLDTHVTIDSDAGALLTELFALPYTFAAPDVIIAELQQVDGQQLLVRGLQSAVFSPEQVLEVMALGQQYRNVSINDLFALILAGLYRCTLVTGDRTLRNLAEHEGLVVHGTLWVLEEMVRCAVVPPLTAADALERMLGHGSRLPKAECERLLRRWKAT